MTRKYTESEIRDIIADNLQCIEPGMVLIDTEHYLPNYKGTKGFVDILAKDCKDHLTVIEVKKSNSTAREAIHEVFKYLEGVKINKGLRDDEIRLLILSTEWDELLIPFSSLCQNSTVNVEGYRIQVSENRTLSSVKRVQPIMHNHERLFCEHHMLRAYTTEQKLQQAIQEHITSFETKGIYDYVLVILKAPKNHREKELAAMEMPYVGYSQEDRAYMSTHNHEHYPDYKFIIYSASQLQSEDIYWDILKKDADIYSNVSEFFTEDSDEEDYLSDLHDYAINSVAPVPSCDTEDIGYAAKLQNYIYNQNWTVEKIIRGKIFNNEFLSDETILDELCGARGGTRQKYLLEFDSENITALKKMKREVSYCLQDNKQWKVPVTTILDTLIDECDKKSFKGKIYIYNPMHTLYTLYLIAAHNNIMNWAPCFFIVVEYPDQTDVYFGEMKHTGNIQDFDIVIEKYFGKTLWDLAFSLTWGGYLPNDVQIAKDLGLGYGVYKTSNIYGKSTHYEYLDYEFTECDEISSMKALTEYFTQNISVINRIVDLFEKDMPAKGYTFI